MRTQSDARLLRTIGIVVLALLAVPLAMMAVAAPMMGGVMIGASPLWGVAMLVGWLLVLGGLGYLLYRGLSGEHDGAADPALEELRLAYARGDLTDEEFEERRENLQREG